MRKHLARIIKTPIFLSFYSFFSIIFLCLTLELHLPLLLSQLQSATTYKFGLDGLRITYSLVSICFSGWYFPLVIEWTANKHTSNSQQDGLLHSDGAGVTPDSDQAALDSSWAPKQSLELNAPSVAVVGSLHLYKIVFWKSLETVVPIYGPQLKL